MLRHHHDLPSPGGVHASPATEQYSTVQVYRTSSLSPAAPGVVLTLPHLLPVVVEPGDVVVVLASSGPHAETNSPGPGGWNHKSP